VAVVIMVLSAFIVVTATFRAGSKTRKLALFASTGYAFPGTILAIGVLIFTGQLDRAIAALFGAQFQGILITSIGVLFLAYIVRFQAVGLWRDDFGCQAASGQYDECQPGLGTRLYGFDPAGDYAIAEKLVSGGDDAGFCRCDERIADDLAVAAV
jgi:iron(III) transport system permease protein